MRIELLLALSLALMPLLTAGQFDPSFCASTEGDNDQLPQLPGASYHAYMQTLNRLDGTVGHTSVLVDANSSRSSVIYETGGGEELKAVFDAATGQILVINQRADAYQLDNCQVMNASASSYELLAKVSFLGSDRVIPTGKLFSGAGVKIKRKNDTELNELTVTPYQTCYYANSIPATVEVTWHYQSGAQTPMQIKAKYRLRNGQPDAELLYAVSPLRVMSDRHDAMRHHLSAPRGVYCKGLISAKQVPKVHNRFSLGLEQFVHNLNSLPLGVEQPFKLRESYDQRANITMIEGEGLIFADDNGKYGAGVVAKISDFTRGISYIKNLRYGNCTYERLPLSNWDGTLTPNGLRIKSPDEFYFPSLAELQYKGSGVYRETEVDIYIGYKDNFPGTGGGPSFATSAEYYLQIKTTYDGQGNPVYEAEPRGLYTASSLRFYSMTDLFDFNSGVPRAFDHDISDCFGATEERHFELILSTSELDANQVKFLDENRDVFVYSLVSSLSSAINISPLRIFQPTVSLFAEPLILAEVTISERASVPGYTPDRPEIPLSEVAGAISRLASSEKLVVDVLEGDMMFPVPIKDYVSLDSRGPNPPPPSGMSSGAAAGLAIGMLLLGALLAVGILFVVNYFRSGAASPFGFKPFGADETVGAGA